MALDEQQTRELYRRRARRYDRTVQLYRLGGFRLRHYREQAALALGLRAGDTVVELGCGTGANFPWLEQAVGPEGRIIGVDLTDAMLHEAEERARREGWKNVELVNCDAARYAFPPGVNGVLSTFAFALMPAYDAIIRNAAEALAPGGRLATLDLKAPEGSPRWLLRLGIFLTRAYGVSADQADRHPWESVARYLDEVEVREFYFGVLRLTVGTRS